jgi:hypothetical protein
MRYLLLLSPVFMLKRIFLTACLLIACLSLVMGQQFDRLHELTKERESLKAIYDKLSSDYKASKSKKPSPEIQAAFENLMSKDAEIIQEIGQAEAAVNSALATAG